MTRITDYTLRAERAAIVYVARKRGCWRGTTQASVATEYDVSVSALRYWLPRADKQADWEAGYKSYKNCREAGYIDGMSEYWYKGFRAARGF